MMRTSLALITVLVAISAGVASAQDAPPPTPQTSESPFWLTAGGGYVSARAGCESCDRSGVYYNSKGILVDVGARLSSRVDAGIEVSWMSTKVEEQDPSRTTFILGVGQFRPWTDRGFSIRAGMGVTFVGNGIFNFTQQNLKPPFTTNALGLVYGIGWEFMREQRFRLQVVATHHVAALGELTFEDNTSIKNIVGNYWTVGGVLVIR